MKKKQWIGIALLTAALVVFAAAVSISSLHKYESDRAAASYSDRQVAAEQQNDSAQLDSLDSLSKKHKSISRQSVLYGVLHALTSNTVDRSIGTETAQEPVELEESETPMAPPEVSEGEEEIPPAEGSGVDEASPAEPEISEPEPAAEPETEPEPEVQPAEEEMTAVEAEEEAEEEPDVTEYGTATGNWGWGNQWQNVQWVEYEKDGVYTLVCSVVDKSLGGEKNAVIRLLGENGRDTGVKSTLQGRVSKIVFRKGITGIGWTYLNSASTSSNNYEPVWPNEASDPDVSYSVDSNKTDVFNGFTKLKTVVPCSTIERIGWSAFRKCSNLNDFDFSKCPHLKEILNQAFNPCPALNHVDLSACNELNVIGWSAFNSSATGSSASLKLPSNGCLSIIGGNSFVNFGKNASACAVDFSGIASSLTQIQRSAFANSNIAGDLSCLDHLTVIGASAFQNTYITGMQISRGITSFPNSAFSGCKSIKKLIWDPASYGSNMNGNEFTASSGFELIIGGNVSKLTNNFFKAMKTAGDIYFEGVPGGHVISVTSGAISGSALPLSNITRNCYVDEHGVLFELTGNDKARVVYCPPGLTEYTVPVEITAPASGSTAARTYVVTAIAPSAFTKARDLQTVSFDDASAIQSVGDKAFYGLGTLTEVVDLGTDPATKALTVSAALALFTGVSDENPVPDNAFQDTGLLNYTTVRYQVKAAKVLTGTTLDGSLPGTVGDAIIDDLASNATITVEDLRSHYYRTIKGTRANHFPYFTYMFRGWRSESGTLVLPGDQITLDAKDSNGKSIYDTDGNGRINLVSEWVGTWKPNSGSTGTPSANFSIWTNVSSANDNIDSAKLLPEQVVNYSPKIGNAIMFAEDENGIVYPDQLLSPASGGNKFIMISYVDSSIVEADQNTRKLVTEGFTATDPRNGKVTWKLSYLPDDETVLSELAEMTRNGEVELKDENGERIPAKQLTTDNYLVRWCAVKYQSGEMDGWNINAKLTKKTSFVAVTKTFSGDADAAGEAIDPQQAGKKPFNITLTSKSDPNKVITLKMKNRILRADALSASAIAHGKLEQDDQYGYIQMIHDDATNTDKYVWIVACDKPDHFYVKENDYSVTLHGVSYGVIAQYNQLNTGRTSDTEIRQWTNRTEITTSPQPADDIDIDRFETTNFYNEYVAKDTFIIENYDEDAVIMPGVEFSVFDEDGRQLKLNAAAGSSAQNRKYSVLLDEGSTSDTAQTGTDGIIRLTLPKKTDRTHVYQIRQTIPEGYIGAGQTAVFLVSVNKNGDFAVNDISGPDDFGAIEPLNGESGNTYGAKVINASKKTDVVVTKSWQDGIIPEDSVSLDLTRTVDGVTGTLEAVDLTADDQWTKTFRNLPVMSGNKPVTYSVDETRIGDDMKGSAAFADWTQNLSAVQKNAHELDLNLRNEHAPDITVTLHKIDSQSGEDLKNVTFRVYKKIDSANASQTVSFKGTEYRSAAPLDVVTSNEGLAELTLRTNHTYFIEEYIAPNGYDSLGVFLELTVDGNGKVTVVRDTAKASSVVCSADNRTITVKNDPVRTPAPTNYAPVIIPFVIIALLALLLLGVLWMRKKSL